MDATLPTMEVDPLEADRAVDALARILRGRRVAALTGAGASTESGIPDYRGPETRRRARNPIQHRAFVSDERARKRYWARAVIGWPRFSAARPNPGHVALAEMEARGHVRGVITQNVDRLHQAAGSARVIELHGALANVRCTSCDAIEPRAALHERLLAENASFADAHAELAPDGDADFEGELVRSFVVAPCLRCGGVLKPDVVFFGDNCRPEVARDAWALFDECEVLLVVGSSLAVFSGYRFVKRASERGMPIAMVNLGETRGDALATLRVEARSGELLPRLARALGGG
jgi:NAD-dependent SIR2 family protein deacetylase